MIYMNMIGSKANMAQNSKILILRAGGADVRLLNGGASAPAAFKGPLANSASIDLSQDELRTYVPRKRKQRCL